ncbi:MAG: beta-ketoacyl-ACP synthase II [candidate division Zixibacteria bacterium]|nr:beta-ketoacyl-ACP synthase II [candidate division Zixibacteria bacterium]
MNKRVVVTGLGCVTPVGKNVPETWDAVINGRSGVDRVSKFDVTDYPTKIAAEIKNFDPSSFLEKKEMRRMDISEQYAIVSSQQALDESGLDLEKVDRDRCGVVVGSGIGGITTFEIQHQALITSGPGRVSPFFIPMMIVDMSAGLISMRYNLRGPNYATVSACASSAHAIIDAFRIIQRGEADVMITGGTEAAITPTSLAGFCQAKAMSVRNDEPQRASRPFDKGRDGFVMGEGSGILILEEYEHAVKRGARIYGELIGAGMTGDAYHMTAPHPDGYGARKAMEFALRDAGLAAERVDYINTHGTATDLGDISETRAIKAVLGQHAYRIACNSTKSMVGHMLGAAGAIEMVITLKSIEQGIVHPTINLEEPDPECDLDYVPGQSRKHDINYALSNSFGFGGHNVTLVIKKINGAS